MSVAVHSHNPIPRGALVAVFIALAVLLLGVAALRWSGTDMREPDAAAVSTLALRFEDRPDGGVAVLDVAQNMTHQRLLTTVRGEAGFLRGTLRGLARERRRQGLGDEQPFQLIGRADGRLTLVDPATKQRVDLESFGPSNAAVFMQFMKLGLAAHSAT